MAAKIVEVLTAHEIPVWYSPSKMVGAQQWHDQIGKALAACDWFVLLTSPSAINSKWVKRELLYVLRKDRYEVRILPVLYRPCEIETLSWVLPDYQNINFQNDFTAGCRALLKTWGIEYKKI